MKASPSFGEALRTWARIGTLSFGGPAAQIALMHRVIVDEKKWLSEKQYLGALSFCMLLPGPEAMQLATYSGWRLHGVLGGLAAGLLFVLPGALLVLALAAVYAAYGEVRIVETLFLGIKAAVVVIVIEALLRVSKRALSRMDHWFIAVLSFIALFFLGLPYPLIVIAAGVYGYMSSRNAPSEAGEGVKVRATFSGTLKTALIWGGIWLGPLLLLSFFAGPGAILSDVGWFFSKLAVVTFGGAYAVLAYMGQDVVTAYGWLEAGQMMDGLGLAETTPGPLILVTEFVGYLAAYKHGGGDPAWIMGLLGALVTLWATFAPCFLWIFVGAPYIEWINAHPRLKGALSGITAAVVGVILNLTIWFALHVFFVTVTLENAGFLRLWTPDIETLDWRVALLTIVSGYLLLGRHWSIQAVLGVAASLALTVSYAGDLILI
ncbi:MAG: chromate efflux transporter [Hyphomicrobiales bacterium]|nr:chromate efflux transporter [Hyphomicrobiales bacterium]